MATSNQTGGSVRPTAHLWAVVWLSAAVLGFEISLMRVLLVASWHHFAFVVIGVALLGFGASGTALSLCRAWVLPRGDRILFVLCLATAVSMPVCAALAQYLPIEARFLPAVYWRQVGCWLAYWAILTVPFFLGASAIGLMLMLAGARVAGVYAGNLIGSAVGAVLATALMYLLPPQWLAPAMGGIGLIAASGPTHGAGKARVGAILAAATLLTGWLWLDPPRVRVDPYKYGAYVQRLQRQGEAERLAVAYGPRAVVEAYRSRAFHDLPFLSGSTSPPQMLSLVTDGHRAGSVLRIADPADAAVMEQTLMAFGYAAAPTRPHVLLLGETGGANVWLALRRGAARIDVVQPDARLLSLMRGPLASLGGAVLDRPGVRTVAAQPRHFVDNADGRFDVIQLAGLQSSAAGSGGMGGLGQDHLITIQGIASCLRLLADDGVLFVCRGIQTPARDNLKLLATFIAAMREIGVTTPERHLVIVRDFQAVCTLVKASPWTTGQIDRIRRSCIQRNLTPVWFQGIRPDELNRPDVLPGPPAGDGDWYYYAATQLFSPAAEQFIDDWTFDIRPPTDDRPFFADFCKLRSIGAMRRAFGDLWLTRVEMGFLFVVAAAVAIAVVGAALTILPLAVLQRKAAVGGRAVTVGYFASIGLAYLLLEMTFLSRVTHLIGDPVLAAAVTIAAFLLFSGLGSLTAQRLAHRYEGSSIRGTGSQVPLVMVTLVVVGVVVLFGIGPLSAMAGAWPTLARCLLAVLAIAPLGYLMGFPMPTALARLQRGAPALIPWSWGINGFASVLAGPLATALGMTWGFSIAGVAALALYLAAAALFRHLPDKQNP